MHKIGVIGFVAFGALAIVLAIAHEYTWWKRRGWRRRRGRIIGFTEDRDNDGVTYNPKIQFEDALGLTTFVSKYGSGKQPIIGEEVDILIDESGDAGEQITPSNRILFTLMPMIFGLLFIMVGVTLEPLKLTEQGSAGQPVTRSESDSTGGDKPQPESEAHSR
ncbi:hypothetical protein SAMN02745166_03540 [Prosthecobacter debontii]|uniref:DUF3592 domain-containing protein n=1 Tax=Prosthecobacter debontii TaxID=48467 RepID=A0A1T4YJT8_9BACT|nr:hypothetical protein [Prosthecobacter debontii]SKB02094.1 hypothetical protein SAMN02745166_03540 [Prosthecobacter debontii]